MTLAPRAFDKAMKLALDALDVAMERMDGDEKQRLELAVRARFENPTAAKIAARVAGGEMHPDTAVLEVMHASIAGGATNLALGDIQRATGLGQSIVRTALRSLEENLLIQREGKCRGTRYTVRSDDGAGTTNGTASSGEVKTNSAKVRAAKSAKQHAPGNGASKKNGKAVASAKSAPRSALDLFPGRFPVFHADGTTTWELPEDEVTHG